MKARVLFMVTALTLTSAGAGRSLARDGEIFNIPWYTVDAGGAQLTSGPYRLIGTTGQPDAGVTMAAGLFRLHGGFWSLPFGDDVTFVPDEPNVGSLPAQLRLAAPIPNPFNLSTTFHFDVPAAGPVRLSIHDLSGHRLSVLIAESLSAGIHQVVWNGRDARSRPVASGVYFAVLEAGNRKVVQHLTLVK